MKRKVVQHGPSTLTISLPSGWTKRHNVTKGDEITILEQKDVLWIGAAHTKASKSTSVSLSNLCPALVHKTISALYKAGYDHLTIRHDGPKQLAHIHELLNERFPDFEVVEEKGQHLTVARVSDLQEDKADALFRRLFHFMLSMAEEGVFAAERKDEDAHRQLILRDIHVDRITNYCISILYAHGQREYGNDLALYHLIEQLEKIGDLYKALNEHVMHRTLHPDLIELYRHANIVLREFTEMFFRFSLERANAFVEECERFRSSARELEERQQNPRALHLLRAIVRGLYDLTATTIILNYERHA